MMVVRKRLRRWKMRKQSRRTITSVKLICYPMPCNSWTYMLRNIHFILFSLIFKDFLAYILIDTHASYFYVFFGTL